MPKFKMTAITADGASRSTIVSKTKIEFVVEDVATMKWFCTVHDNKQIMVNKDHIVEMQIEPVNE
jgi:hypothetical protein